MTLHGGFPGREKGPGTHRAFSFSSTSGEGVGTRQGISLGFGGNTTRKDLCDLQKSLPSLVLFPHPSNVRSVDLYGPLLP